MSERKRQSLKAHIRRKKKRRFRLLMSLLISSFLLLFLIGNLVSYLNKPELVVIRPKNEEIYQGEELPKLTANITFAGKRKSRNLDKKGYEVANLLSDLEKGKYYNLVCDGDLTVDNHYPIQVELTEKFKKRLKSEYHGKLELKIEEGMLTVLNTTGTWQTDDTGSMFLLEDGTPLKNRFLNSHGKLYYFDSNGYMVTGDVSIGHNLMHFDQTGGFIQRGESLPLDPNKPMVALTFDDGPNEETSRILDVLEKYNAHATFFILGLQAERFPDLPGRMVSLGSELGNHSYNHANLTKENSESIKEQLKKTDKILKNLCGHSSTVARVPYGAINEKVSTNLGLPAIFWTIDTRDWETKDKDATVAATLEGAGDGHIILLHDIHKSTAEAVEPIIASLYEKGYQLVTVSELAKAKKISLEPGKSYHQLQEN